ncbi:MAG: Alpha-mannosidase [Chloroflexi bacterium AL-W]|nr:Alpha-mannosidase [Chloroflexi bacterium AL-N1]NOK64797.1 Alpha-mannosidase [Chloroflexi bacterium AL-N10]NOK76567.1 Alpha-mannosidase [Chloroflexi bacterium AL-N5]NOK80203.1 Alpha-mannosidase [Chloroflexi bacterium AL-W]NOK86716.1 Alpha-mannosidase [Chloroflexi bacterium AL-N15]
MSHQIRWTAQKIAHRLLLIEPLVYRQRQPLEPFRYHTLSGPAEEPPVTAEVADSDWRTIEPPAYWGQENTNFVLRTTFRVPQGWSTADAIALWLPLGETGDFCHPEALAYIDGQPYAACDRFHQEICLPATWCDAQTHLLALHGWTGNGVAHGRQHFMQPCAIVQIDQPTRDFIATARIALGVVQNLPEQSTARSHLLHALDQAFTILDTREPFDERFYASVESAHTALREGIAHAGPPTAPDIIATGHAHIDVAWLWTLGQTRRKAGRTFHNVLRLMEQFPDYHFTQSQPQLYEYVRQDYPELFEQIKTQVAEGRWGITGDMWVEADCNLSGAEALARQFLLGRSFFQEHFGHDTASPVLWLPDVFGYAWALPQLIKQAGLAYFFTIKIGWSQYNRLPYDSFWWQGIDGSRVLTHFSTTPEIGSVHASTYNAMATPKDILDTWTNFQQQDLTTNGKTPPILMAFGHGDGGGGPTREMLENLREMANFPATPRVQQASVGEFFQQLEQTVGDQLPTWNGELYLEYHRGTYTTQSRNKRANRKSEFLLHDAEFLATLAATLNTDYVYPTEAFRDCWRLICLNQFHDIIPGSSITPVYVESLEQYDEIRTTGEDIRTSALQTIARTLGGNILVVNPTSFTRSDLTLWPENLATDAHLQCGNGTVVVTQTTSDGVLVALEDQAPYSITPLTIAAGKAPPIPNTLTATPNRLENDYLLVELNTDGDLTRIYDKTNTREVLPSGALANQFQAFEDRPLRWDAWDIDIFYEDKQWIAEPATSIEVIENGPLRATLAIRRRILNSTYVQRISLRYNSARLDFDTTIDWRERHVLLKVAFPVDVLTPMATYDIQWGNVQRPTHHNTSWDWARFETCAQKWVDLSEGGYGVSLLNDCKYGHDIRDNVMRISLLRSPTMPDPEADQGEHRFTYSLLPHREGWGTTTIQEAYALNNPALIHTCQSSSVDHQPSTDGDNGSFVMVDQPHVVIETVKQAENGNGIIVRLYESQRRRGPVTLTTRFGLTSASRTNLLEEHQESLSCNSHQVTFTISPYEIVTLRLVPN